MSVDDGPTVLVQGTADWNQPIATNQHYMVRELARTFPVTFVESLGLRRPTLSRSDLLRAVERFSPRPDGGTRRAVPEGARVLSPRVIPVHAAPWTALNKRILARQLRPWMAGTGRKVYWTYSPVTYGFDEFADMSVYHCVDLYGEYPGIDKALIDRSERALARSDVIAVGSSEVVVEHLQRQGFSTVLYWPNVADTAVIQRVADETEPSPRSGALFAGNLSEKKVDFGVLRALVDQGVEVHLAGPVDEGGGRSRVLTGELVAAGAKYHGVLSLAELSRLMLQCRVGLIPYQINGYTNGVSPLKTFEYLAAGLSVIATALPGVQAVDSRVHAAGSPGEFIALVKMCVDTWGEEQVPQCVALAQGHSWTRRGAEARQLLADILLPAGSRA